MPENPSRDPIIGDWWGEPTYRCPLCSFDTGSLENFNDHMRAVHYLPEGHDPDEEPPEVVDPEPAPKAEPAPTPKKTAAPESGPKETGEEEGK